MVGITLDASDLCAVPNHSFVAPVRHYIFPYRLNWQIATDVGRVFTHEDYLVTRVSRSDHSFGQYSDSHELVTRGLNVNVNTYPSAPYFITTTVPVPSGSAVIPLFILCNYEGVAQEWRPDRYFPGHAIGKAVKNVPTGRAFVIRVRLCTYPFL